MTPHHFSLSALLKEASLKEGQLALARKLGLLETEVSGLINCRRFVTLRQALRVEAVLKISAREVLIEASMLRIDEALEKASMAQKQPDTAGTARGRGHGL